LEATFITAQVEGNAVVYSILVNKGKTKLRREEVEGRFRGELLQTRRCSITHT
jgi:hypothetical protein